MNSIRIKRYKLDAEIPAIGLHPGEFIASLDKKKLYLCLAVNERIAINVLLKTEVLSGSVDGINKVFTTSSAYVAGTIVVFLNGLKEIYFTESTDTTVTLEDAPKNIGFQDRIEATYTLKS